MDFASLPPEINSGRIYAGPGSTSMLAAAAAWTSLAVELQSTAAAYSSAISVLTADWQGPSSTEMVAAVQPYIEWLHATAEQAEQTGSGAMTAAAAYQTVLAAMVPPPAIAANRNLLSALVATNIVGENNAAIATTEAAYGDMWAQDLAAMYVYAESASIATQLDEFEQPPSTTRGHSLDSRPLPTAPPDGGAKSALSQQLSAMPAALHGAALAAADDPTGADLGAIQALSGLVSQVQAAAVVSVISGLGITAGNLSATLDAAATAGTVGAVPDLAGVPSASATRPTTAVELGRARSVGALTVPPSWTAGTPTVRLAAAAWSGISAPIGPAVVDASFGSAIGQMAVASMAGSALGGANPASVRGHAVQEGRPLSDDDDKTPDKLTRVLAQLSQEPKSLQHWHTDKAHLDGLLEQLSNRPGIHAVHVSKKPRASTKLPRPF